jgi:hypothetical protein
MNLLRPTSLLRRTSRRRLMTAARPTTLAHRQVMTLARPVVMTVGRRTILARRPATAVVGNNARPQSY